jgi:hypothetical protein
VDTLERRGQDMLDHHNILAARVLLLPVALVGRKEAARMVAQTYDPGWLRRAGFEPVKVLDLFDVWKAAYWWTRAARLGDQAAMSRFRDVGSN